MRSKNNALLPNEYNIFQDQNVTSYKSRYIAKTLSQYLHYVLDYTTDPEHVDKAVKIEPTILESYKELHQDNNNVLERMIHFGWIPTFHQCIYICRWRRIENLELLCEKGVFGLTAQIFCNEEELGYCHSEDGTMIATCDNTAKFGKLDIMVAEVLFKYSRINFEQFEYIKKCEKLYGGSSPLSECIECNLNTSLIIYDRSLNPTKHLLTLLNLNFSEI